MNITPIGYKSYESRNEVYFQAAWKHACTNGRLISAHTGPPIIKNDFRERVTIFPQILTNRYAYKLNASEIANLEARKDAVLEKLKTITFMFDADEDNKVLWSNELLLNCKLPVYTTERFVKNGVGEHLNYSVLTPQSMAIVEKFISNEVFYKNEVLRQDIMDEIIFDFTETMSKYTGIRFRNNMEERAKKIHMIMDAYLNNPPAQNSAIMEENIGYFMYRAAYAPLKLVERAIEVISNPDLSNNKDTVDSLLFSMDPTNDFNDIADMPTDIRERLKRAAIEADRLQYVKHDKTCRITLPDSNDESINIINLPVIEKFLDNKELNQHKFWRKVLADLIGCINFNNMLYGEDDAKYSAEHFMNIMNEFLNDKEAQKNRDEDNIDYINKLFEINVLTDS